jgi:hypothetical protein
MEILSELGHPVVAVEITEPQLEQAIRTGGSFVSAYFPKECKMAYFYTQPLVGDYDLPADAYWIQQVNWDPATTRIGDIFGAESFLFNIGNVSGLQNILLDYYLLQHYRKASQRFLGTEGQWEVKGNNKIRLIPTPRGSFPVVVEYFPRIYQFRSTQAREICKRMMVAETKIMVGHARGKFSNIPAPGGGNMGLNGEALRTEGMQEKEKALQDAILLGEPLSVYIH